MKPALVLLGILVLATGCVHRAVEQKTTISPDAALRSIFQQQTQGAFNPVTDDRRFGALQVRLKLNPQDFAARLELAGVYENYRLYDEGLEQYRESLRLARSVPGDNASFAEKAVLGLRRCAQASSRAREAVPLLEEFLKESPSAISWNELGLLQDALGDFASGEIAFREAIERDAKSDRFHNNLGYNLLLQNKSEAAEAEFRQALALNPKSITTRNNLGGLLARRGDLQGALQQFQFSADAATAHNNLAVVLLELGQYEQSRDELVKALALRHYFAPALSNFKLVQERIRDRAGLQKPGGVPPSKSPAAVVQSKDPEDRQ
ncbi:MAG TPA: tetratricopeptide repeat protein [Terriglobia bacterium]|nr:tetratricopeptide repeat protein [Terriglobia bacterium]